MRKRFLLTGGSGLLGTELQKHLDCEAPSRKELDITDITTFIPYVNSYPYPEIVVHCAAYTNVPGAENNRLEAIKSNILGTLNVANVFPERRIVYISTDYVYPGTIGNYKEIDKVEPFNFYAFTKLCGEAFMDPDKDLVIRTSFKPRKWPHPKACHDLYTSADFVDVIAKEIALVIDSDLTGIINVGTDRKSILDLVRRVKPTVDAMSVTEIQNVKMPNDISMDLTKFKEFKDKSGGR